MKRFWSSNLVTLAYQKSTTSSCIDNFRTFLRQHGLMSFISLNIPEREINLHFVNSAGLQQNAPFCALLKNISFFHGFITLYLKFWLHRFYIDEFIGMGYDCLHDNAVIAFSVIKVPRVFWRCNYRNKMPHIHFCHG
jgi:hypothetical protein